MSANHDSPWSHQRRGAVERAFGVLPVAARRHRADPDRQAAFERDHPTERYTRQAKAVGVPEPTPQVAPVYGEPGRRETSKSVQKAADEAAKAEAFTGPKLGDPRLGRGSITLINKEALRSLESGTDAHASRLVAERRTQPRQPARDKPAAESTGAAAASSARPAPAAASKKASVMPSKFAPLSKLAKQSSNRSLLLAAQQRGTLLNEALAKLDRQTAQYQEQLGLKRELNAATQALLKERSQLVRLLKAAAKELQTAQERLQPFDEAAAKLKEEGMRDIPRLYATGVTDGKIHPHCFFNTYAHQSLSRPLGGMLPLLADANLGRRGIETRANRYMNDAVRNVHQPTHHT